MEKDKDKNREPFPADKTPTPPQVMDASKPPENTRKPEEENEKKKKSKPGTGDEKIEDTGKRLGESPIEIDDETTI